MADGRVRRRVLIPADDKTAIFNVHTCHGRRRGAELVQIYTPLVASDTCGGFFLRTSPDNGRTWSAAASIYRPETTPQGVRRWGESCLFLDEDEDAVLFFCNHSIYPQSTYTGDVARLSRIMLSVSRDAGRTFSPARPIVQRGFDETAYARGVAYGRNSVVVSFVSPLKLKSGELLLPAQVCSADADFAKPYYIRREAVCFLGSWQRGELEWDYSATVGIDAGRSSRGLCEPAVAELADGTLLMVCRGSNASIPEAPGRKWVSASTDAGRTWSPVQPFAYDDGEPFYSPSTGSRLIRSSRSGTLYWIGNISPQNPDGNRPRFPLVMAEVDEARRCLRRESRLTIDDCGPDDGPLVQLSNFRVYEDRETGVFVLTMARIQERQKDGSSRTTDITSPAYEYRISV